MKKNMSYINLIAGALLILLAITIVKNPIHFSISILFGGINIIYGMGWQENIIKYFKK